MIFEHEVRNSGNIFLINTCGDGKNELIPFNISLLKCGYTCK
uniref:Uncharacterized protein n=1 Tax=Anguilla anguilla TaxID=7936 RepID=A0A0E9PZV5_ANGAN